MKQALTRWTRRLVTFVDDHFVFASSDLLILDNLMEQFMGEVTVAECKAFYALQSFIETIHSETYATMLHKFVPDGPSDYVDGLNKIASIRAKGAWARKFMDPGPFAVRLWPFASSRGCCSRRPTCVPSTGYVRREISVPG